MWLRSNVSIRKKDRVPCSPFCISLVPRVVSSGFSLGEMEMVGANRIGISSAAGKGLPLDVDLFRNNQGQAKAHLRGRDLK